MKFLAFLWDTGADMLERGDYLRFTGFLLGLSISFAAFILLFWIGVEFVLKYFEEILILVGIPIGCVAGIRYALQGRREPPPPVPAPAPEPKPETIELVRARADNTYPLMAQTAFLLFTELCHYLPGLIRPFSLGAVEAPTKYSIMGDFVTVFHFVLPKGTEDTPATTAKEILDTIIAQHLRSQDLPLAVPATYTNQNGEVYPGLVCDGIFDVGQFFKVDFVITNEAETIRLKARQISGMSGVSLIPEIKDKDFD